MVHTYTHIMSTTHSRAHAHTRTCVDSCTGKGKHSSDRGRAAAKRKRESVNDSVVASSSQEEVKATEFIPVLQEDHEHFKWLTAHFPNLPARYCILLLLLLSASSSSSLIYTPTHTHTLSSTTYSPSLTRAHTHTRTHTHNRKKIIHAYSSGRPTEASTSWRHNLFMNAPYKKGWLEGV